MSPVARLWQVCWSAARSRAFALGIAVAATAALRPCTAFADSVPVEAKELFARGRELRLQGQCASAVALFRRAYEVYPQGLGSLRNFAECEESLGHFVSARRAWLDLSIALRTNREARYEGWAEDAQQGAERVASHAASLSKGAALNVDGADAAATPADPPRRTPALADVASPRRGPDATQTAAWVAFGVSGASLVAAGIAGLAYLSASDDLTQTCPMNVCADSTQARSRVEQIRNRGETARTFGLVFLTAGCVGAGAGVVLWTTRHPASASASLSASPWGVTMAGRF